MRQKGRFHELLLMVETCQGATMYRRIASEGVLLAASSAKGENSYSHHSDGDLGVSVIDRFTFHTLQFFEGVALGSRATLADLYRALGRAALGSTFSHE